MIKNVFIRTRYTKKDKHITNDSLNFFYLFTVKNKHSFTVKYIIV